MSSISNPFPKFFLSLELGAAGRKAKKQAKRKLETGSKLSESVKSHDDDDDYDEDEEDAVDITEEEKRRILYLTEAPRPWLSPFYNK